ncbi:MAG: TonB-dependent receptor plug domain-containing protein, partial [Chitinophagaceae bacterium]|nr:TonB-dependent receptor plug domain-containing protein [Chitinophagaceae bacterium]
MAAKVGGQTVQTDGDGVFSISAAKSDQLIFTMVGYQSRELSAGLPTPIQVAMQADNARLNEVVVVGYGTQSRRNVTSAISKLDAQVLASTPRANVGTALQGTVSGLQVVNATGSPGATPLIVLRGGASINSPGAPLVVVDGIIRAFNDIAAQDIASIELLKDAAATAIYGARANNGVILIVVIKTGVIFTAVIATRHIHIVVIGAGIPEQQVFN